MLFAPVKRVKVLAQVVDNDGILLLRAVCQSFDKWS